ncbi:unnamed protein product [Paramecium octaurelia]|uniref:Uncharacterized protein n=1 Tax=Paramecium octaurelia TaxID=43137 RepID=A0A8S1YN92_PAROT|nr:unnamed protein product [Paramecium octaurelia]
MIESIKRKSIFELRFIKDNCLPHFFSASILIFYWKSTYDLQPKLGGQGRLQCVTQNREKLHESGKGLQFTSNHLKIKINDKINCGQERMGRQDKLRGNQELKENAKALAQNILSLCISTQTKESMKDLILWFNAQVTQYYWCDN